jgi:hypothetical protein
MGRIPIPVCLLNERRKMAVMLKTSGLTNLSVLQEINRLADTKFWGKITLRTLESDIAAHFREHKAISIYEEDHLDMMRQAHLAQMENTIEEMALIIMEKNKKSTWKPFEKAAALEKYHRMQLNFAQIQGWDFSKKYSYEVFTTKFGAFNRDIDRWEKASNELAKMSDEDRNQLANFFRSLSETQSGIQMFQEIIKTAKDNWEDEFSGDYYLY